MHSSIMPSSSPVVCFVLLLWSISINMGLAQSVIVPLTGTHLAESSLGCNDCAVSFNSSCRTAYRDSPGHYCGQLLQYDGLKDVVGSTAVCCPRGTYNETFTCERVWEAKRTRSSYQCVLSPHQPEPSSGFSGLAVFGFCCLAGLVVGICTFVLTMDYNESKASLKSKEVVLMKPAPKAAEFRGDIQETYYIEKIRAEVMDRNPQVRWDDVASLHVARALLEEAVMLPLVFPKYFRGIRRSWRGVLLYGPPGTGKTLLAKALCTEMNVTFFNVSPSVFSNKFVGESEKIVRLVFEMARFYAPSVIFIDEIDSLASVRGASNEPEYNRKIKSQLLTEMDGVSKHPDQDASKFVMVLGATNRPQDIDEAIRRRLEKRIYIPLPDEEGRRELIQINMRDLQLDKDIDVEELVRLSDGYSGADLTMICRDASMAHMRSVIDGKTYTQLKELTMKELDAPISHKDFVDALNRIKPNSDKTSMTQYKQWGEKFGSE